MLKILLLNRPFYLSTKNDLSSLDWKKSCLRALLFALLCAGIAIGLYLTTERLLFEIAQLSIYVYIPYEQVLGLFLLFLLFALVVSNLAISFGRIYQSHDLDLLLATPLRFSSFFTARLIGICLSSSWMPLIFLGPVLLAFMVAAGQNSLFTWLIVLIILLPYFLLPTTCSLIIASLFLYFSPRAYGRLLILVFLSAGFWLSFKIAKVISSSSDTIASTSGILKAISVLSLPQINWLPTNWVARCFNAILKNELVWLLPEFHLLLLTPLATGCLAYIIFVGLFDKALERERGAKSHVSEKKSYLQKLLAIVFDANSTRALLFKEYTLIYRETAQVVQLLLLLLLAFLYVSNLETIASASEFTAKFDVAWTRFLAIVSLAVGCFFILAISTRIIFPSISLEGRAFWFLISRPILPEQIMQIKFWIWFIPLAILAAAFFIIGAIALNVPVFALPSIAIFGVVSAYGVVGLAVGMGAQFASFDWEYSTQLVASFGSIMYMLTAISLLTITCLPLGFYILLLTYPAIFQNMTELQQITALAFIILGIWLPHILAVHWSFTKGLQELRARVA